MKKTSPWWVFVLGAVMLMGLAAQAGDHAFVGASKCKMCHKVQFNSWSETSHAKATDAAKSSTERQFEAACLKCHATNADEQMPGVQCEACHGAGEDFKKMSVMKDREQAIANGLVIPSQETCNRCHVDDGHSKPVVIGEQRDNRAAIHEFKSDATE